MADSVLDRLQKKLEQVGVRYQVSRHAPVFTSEEAAAVRGTPLASGAKALIVKAGEAFVLLVLPADRKLDSKQARSALGVKGIRFATREEVEQVTGLQPGSIPPFGSLFGLPTTCDPALSANAGINFNAGDHAVSIAMTYADYLVAEQPRLASLSETPA